MRDAPLRIEGRDRLRPSLLAARGVNGGHGHGGIDRRQHAAHHFAALIHLRHERVRLQAVVERDRPRGPDVRPGRLHGRVLQHEEPALAGHAGRHDPAGGGAPMSSRRRINRDDDARHRGRRVDPAPLHHVAREERVGPLLDEGALEFLSAEPRAGVARDDPIEKGRREVQRVGAGRDRRDGARRVRRETLQQRDRPRRSRHQFARVRAESEAELQHVPRRIRVAPFRELVRPGSAELRAAQTVRIVGGEALRDRAVAPLEPLARRLPLRTVVAAMHREKARDALHHHLARICGRFAHERDAPDRRSCEGRDT